MFGNPDAMGEFIEGIVAARRRTLGRYRDKTEAEADMMMTMFRFLWIIAKQDGWTVEDFLAMAADGCCDEDAEAPSCAAN